ncbi:MAG: MBL fold metallo-hydrolase [Syntrophales bacterium]|nr:MBL fold metallo-hydrolase [Syntrophales bacterium]MDD5531233.1 MBL fold metallo-hydrolase [Syntrophales bacterium]
MEKQGKAGLLIRQLQVGRMAIFAYIVGDKNSGEALLIDPAAETDRILAECAKNGLSVKYIVNTHGHVDHISGNADVKQKTGAGIVVHEKDADMLTSTPGMILKMFGAKASPPADLTVKDGDSISAGGISLQVLHTPGHTPGGMCLYTPGYVFTGDTLFVGGVGRTDLPGGSWRVLSDSIRTKLLVLPETTVVLPGHNYGYSAQSTIGKEKAGNQFLK